jgi:hypothetical protein
VVADEGFSGEASTVEILACRLLVLWLAASTYRFNRWRNASTENDALTTV